MNTIVKIGTSSCMPCRMLKPIFHQLKEEFGDKITFLEISDDSDPIMLQKYCVKFGIRGVPVVLVLDSNENELERITGLANIQTYTELIQKYI